MNLKERSSPIRVYWDIAPERSSIDYKGISEQIVTNKILSLQVSDSGQVLSNACLTILETLKGQTSCNFPMRLQRQFGSSQSTVGLSVAGMQRDFTTDSPLQSAITRRAIAGGGDWRLRFQNGRYNLSGHLGMSHVTGDTAAIRRIQRNSAHYFQRPDAPYLGYDPTRTSLTGVIAEIRGSKNAGNWLWSAEVNTQSPGFETNDMGRLQRAGQTEFRGDLNYRQTVPGGVFRRWNVGLNGSSRWNYGGDRGDTRLSLARAGDRVRARA